MQTFLPYPSFMMSARVLDNKRLNKQIVKCSQILDCLLGIKTGWRHHPAVKMWRGCEWWLASYMQDMSYEWRMRGNGKHKLYMRGLQVQTEHFNSLGGDIPDFYDYEPFHLSHQSNLVRKYPEYYRWLFPDVPDDLPYVWVVDGKAYSGSTKNEPFHIFSEEAK